jgi:hypothetical protein
VDPNKLMPCPARTVFVRFTAEHYPNSGNVVKGFFFGGYGEKSP